MQAFFGKYWGKRLLPEGVCPKAFLCCKSTYQSPVSAQKSCTDKPCSSVIHYNSDLSLCRIERSNLLEEILLDLYSVIACEALCRLDRKSVV